MNETSGAHLLLLKNETKNETKTNIPKVIYKILITADGKVPEIDSLHSKNQRDALLSWTDKSPGYNIRYFGLDDCRSYLKEHFHPVVLRAFDCIKANAGKTDLFRAAVVYREGGWYSDWREVLLHDGLLDKLVDVSVQKGGAFVFTWDRGSPLHRQNNCVMTAFFGGPPKNPMLLEVIRLIVVNVQKEYYGPSPQSITGPCVYGQAYQNIYGKSRNREQVPPIAGKYQWNKYWFRFLTKTKEVVIQHKYDNPNRTNFDSWHEVGGNDYDYRKMYAEGKYFCSAARNIFHTAM